MNNIKIVIKTNFYFFRSSLIYWFWYVKFHDVNIAIVLYDIMKKFLMYYLIILDYFSSQELVFL